MLFFYLRLFPYERFRYACYALIVFVLCSSIVFLFLSIFQCTPIDFIWSGWQDPVGYGPHQCIDVTKAAYVTAGFYTLQDFLILVLPIPILSRLNVSLRSKVEVFVMFGIGAFVFITACVRLQYIVLFSRSHNPTWDYMDIMIWSGLEVCVSMIVTSLPAVRLLFNRLALRLRAFMRTMCSSSQAQNQGTEGSHLASARNKRPFASNSRMDSGNDTMYLENSALELGVWEREDPEDKFSIESSTSSHIATSSASMNQGTNVITSNTFGRRLSIENGSMGSG
jgi:hypothetical protein